MHQKLSVIITTLNEEDNIRGVLESVQWADEIIVVDSFSTDQTVPIVQHYNAVLHQRAYKGPADQKNWAIPKASHEWVLILDADERVSEELRKDVQERINDPQNSFDAFWIARQNYFMGGKVRYSGWQNDAVIRLIKRDKCRYNQKQVHEEIETAGISVGKITTPLKHYTFKSTDHFLEKIQRYARWSATDHEKKTRKVTIFHLLIKPLFRFFKHFIIQKGFLDGKRGFIISVIMAWGVFLRYLNLIEQQIKDL